jgi:hypothetical protein
MSTADKIRELNDQFRQSMRGGQLMLTRGIAGRSDTDVILDQVRRFTTFSQDNDPHGEHDFGAFDHRGDKIFWKIDYYDLALAQGSDDPADPSVTTRVLTVMLADEY